MKIAANPPEARESAVKITDTCYELFYLPPVSLGTINKTKGYWYTPDGMRFISNRDALEYLKRAWIQQQEGMKAAFTPTGSAAAAAAAAAVHAAEEEKRQQAEEKRRRKEEEAKKKAVIVPSLKKEVDSSPSPEEILRVLQHLNTKGRVAVAEAGARGSRKK